MHTKKYMSGMMLVEALVAVLIVSVGMLGISKLQGTLIAGAGLSKARVEATAFAESKIEELRNNLTLTQYDDNIATGTQSWNGMNAGFTANWTVTDIVNPPQKRIQVQVSWPDELNITQQMVLYSTVAWDDPLLAARLNDPSGNPMGIKPPTGAAERGEGSHDGIPEGAQANEDGSGTYTHQNEQGDTELLDATGKILLKLSGENGTVDFATISGRVYFDDLASGQAIPSAAADVRLSSEGICFYSNTTTATSGSFRYFPYVCYVGPDWYGNVGILLSTQGSAPKICVGTVGYSDVGTTTSPHAAVSHTRTYRGFKASGMTYLSTGMASGSRYPADGLPIPSALGLGTFSPDAFDHHFLLTRSNSACATRLALISSDFSHNFGRNVCINPHSDAAPAVCPDTWPGFAGGQVSEPGLCLNSITGGMVNQHGSVSIVSSSPEISCATGGQLGNRNFSCQANAAEGSEIMVRNFRVHNNDAYCYQIPVTANCASTEIDFSNESGRLPCP